MSSLSIVVPRLGANDLFESTLASILRYRMAHHQVIVVQSDLQADTYGLEDEVDFVEVSGRPGLAKYLNQIEKVLKHQTVNLIRPGVEVTHHWFAEPIRRFQNRQIGSVSCSMVAASYRDEVVSYGLSTNRSMVPVHVSNVRQRPLGPCGWAGFYRRDVLAAIGSLDENISDDFTALDLALSIRDLGFENEVARDRVLTIEDSRMLRLPVRQQTGRDAQRMVQRHLNREQQRVGSMVAVGAELFSSIWRPSHWTKIAGRFSARNKQATDRAFGRRLALARHELESRAGSPDLVSRKAA